MTGLEKLVFGAGHEAELARFVAEVSASGPRVMLIALPLRDEYVDAAERRFGGKLSEFERRIKAIRGADFEHYRRGKELGIPKTGFYDYGHMAPSGTKLMTAAFADLVRDKIRDVQRRPSSGGVTASSGVVFDVAEVGVDASVGRDPPSSAGGEWRSCRRPARARNRCNPVFGRPGFFSTGRLVDERATVGLVAVQEEVALVEPRRASRTEGRSAGGR